MTHARAPGRDADGRAGTPALVASGVAVGYDGSPVLAGIDLEVAPGEVLALLGPSGSGKSTLLGAIAGFLRLSAGELRIAGRTVASVPGRLHLAPERREVGVVFQSYALWPHLSALDNVAYPYRRRGMAEADARTEARRILERLGIARLADRRPAELSGGEQQRVGLGRALAREARLYLFDEPTAHLDAALRTRLQDELAEHRRRAGAAAIHATHDTAEALALADRVALIRDGRLIQHGTPVEVYERPVDGWAAELTGPASVIDARIAGAAEAGRAVVEIGDRHVTVDLAVPDGAADRPARLLVRPDWGRLGGDLGATVASAAYRGTHTDYALVTPAGTVGVRHPGPPVASAGDAVGWTLDRAWRLASDGQPAAPTARSAGITSRP